MKIFLCAVLLFASTGCMSTRIELDPKWNPAAKPAYEDYMDSFLLGFVGSSEISLSRVCMDQKPYGIRRYRSAADGFLSVITAGIYAPYTVRVWCGD